MDLKKIYKPLKKVIKDLKWRKYKLKFMIKRLERKKLEPISDFNNHLQNGLNSIQIAINEIEEGIKNLRNFVATGGIEKPRSKAVLNFQEKEVYDVLLCGIKLHIKPEMLVIIIRSCFKKQKVLILLDNHLEYLKEVISEFFEFIFEESFKKEIRPILKSERIKNMYSDYVIVENNGKMRDKLKNKSLIETKFLEELVKDYYKENDVNLGRESLRYKLQELYTLSKALIDFYSKKKNILIPKLAIKHLEDIFFLKITKDYLKFLIQIAKNYFNIDIKYAKDYVADQIAHLMGN